MIADTLNRRLAAWLLTLPAPIAANSRDAALRKAAARFGEMPEQFAHALSDLGYDLRATHQGFAITFAQKAA